MGGPLIFVLVLACIHLLVSGQLSDAQQASLHTQHCQRKHGTWLAFSIVLFEMPLLKLRQKAVTASEDRRYMF